MKRFFTFLFVLCSLQNNIVLAAQESTTVRINDDMDETMNLISKEKIIKSSNPLSEEFANDLKENIDQWKKKQNTPYKEITINNRTIPVIFKSNTLPENLFLAPNYSTTLIFLDKLGQAWPINQYIMGDPENFVINAIPTNTLVITPKDIYRKTNLTIFFKDIAVPAIFTINSSSDFVDYKVEAMIDKFNPDNKNLNIKLGKTNNNQNISVKNGTNPYSEFPDIEITNLLNGEIPDIFKDKKKETQGYENISVYEINEKYYILTDALVKTPEPFDARAGATGNKLFITMALPFLFLTKDGELIKVLIKD